jgi:RsiW-degrading membrane proteinase PrsW (M82 family)
MQILVILFLALAGAIVPTVFYVYLVWWLDRYEREPLWLIAVAFGWGAIPAVLIGLVPELIFDQVLEPAVQNGDVFSALSFGISPPLFEESAKGIFLIALLLLFWPEYDDPLDGIIYGAMVGFGFAMTENFFYSLSAASEGGVGGQILNILLRSGLFGLNHAFFTSWTGLALGWARTHTGFFHRLVVPVLGWMTAMFFHSIHNLGATFAEATGCLSFLVSIVSDWGGILLMTLIAFWYIGREHLWLVTELQPEVANGLLTQKEYEVLVSSRRRTGARLQALLGQGLGAHHRLGQFYAAATKLAFKKHELSTYGEERGNSAEIARLRTSLQKMRTGQSS